MLPEVFRELEALPLIIGRDAVSVNLPGPCRHFLINKAGDKLPMFKHERGVMAAHFKHGPAAVGAIGTPSEAGIEEARIMHPEFA